MRFLEFRLTRLRACFLLTPALAGACGGGGSNSRDKVDPPSLEFEGAENANGEEFDSDDEVVTLACDPRLTFLLGPSTVASGLLDNWLLRPPNNCNVQQTQCGYIGIELLDQDGAVLHRFRRASLAFWVDFATLDASAVASVRARLVAGNTGNDFVYVTDEGEEKTVTASWDLRIDLAEDCDGMGGASMGGASMGGMGGLGGLSLGGMGPD